MKNYWKNDFHGNDLKLEKEPTPAEVIDSIGDPTKYKEIIFCGYGDCLTRPQEVKEISKWLKQKGSKIRINTAGLANKFWKKNVLPDLAGLIDHISISLNGSNAKEHNKINHPNFGEQSFDEILKFVEESKKHIPKVTITAVAFENLDTDKISQIAKTLGVNFRLRQFEK
jgi:TatD DNase family protein